MQKQFENSSIIYTTSSFAKIRGFTITLLYVLENRSLSTTEVAEITGKPVNYVGSYLCRLRNYGLAKKEGFFWKLTEEGVYFLDHIKNFEEIKKEEKRRICNIIYKTQQMNNRSTTDKQQMNNTYILKKPKQLSIHLWIKNSHRSIDDAEKEVVEVLLDHYNKTGSKFIFISPPDMYAVAERFNITPDQAEQALRNLYQDRIVYHRHDRQHNAIKLGLYKDFIEKLAFAAELSKN